MIESIITNALVLPSNSSNVTFTREDLRSRSANCCGWLSHVEGSPLYKIIKGGTYEVDLNATLTSATAGTVALALYQDGVLIPATISATTIATAGNVANISFKKKFRVCCNANATITIASVPTVNTGVTGTTATTTQAPVITNATLNIAKLP